MKCQSDFSAETDALLTQADECLEEWWEGDTQQTEEPSEKMWDEDDPALIVTREARKRGLIHEGEAAGV
jgi:hypothetical protein